MLSLSRKPGQRIFIGRDIVITVAKIKNGQAVIGIDAPRDMTILREEVHDRDLDTQPEHNA